MSLPSIAIVYDWATTPYGGAEKVLSALHSAFPQAPLFTTIANKKKAVWLTNWQVHTSWLQNLPLATTHHRLYGLLMPLAFESLNLDDYQIIISVTSASAKGILTKPKQLHISYVLTPPRYIYTHRSEYLKSSLLRRLTNPFFKYVQWWDKVAAQRPDKVIAISQLVAHRIATHYHRQADMVIYPPLDPLAASQSPVHLPQPTKFFVVVSRLVSYKRIDLAIRASLKTQKPLVIIGDGPEMSRLQAIANNSPFIHFLGSQPDAITAWYLRHSQALVMPGIEDFGITALEAISAGSPVIVHQESGVSEILNQTNALFIHDLTVDALATAYKKLEQKPYNRNKLRQSVSKYVTTSFVKKFTAAIESYWSIHHQERTV